MGGASVMASPVPSTIVMTAAALDIYLSWLTHRRRGVGASVVVSAAALELLGGATAPKGDCNHAAPHMASVLEGDCDQTTAPHMASVNHEVNARMLRNFAGALRAGSAQIAAISFTVYSA